jgi:membrane protease YdiL (CAAX protease family)
MGPPETPAPEMPPESDHAPRSSIFREVPWRWGDVLIGCAPPLLMRIALASIRPEWFPALPRWAWLPLTALALAWMLFYPLWVARRRHAWPPRVPRPRAVLVESLFALIALVGIFLANVAIFLILVNLAGVPAQSSDPIGAIARSPDRFERWSLVVLAIAVAPVAEEVFFRGMLYNALRRYLGPTSAAIVQGAAFGLVHPFDFARRTVIAFTGFALAKVYDRRRTLLTPILLHAMINGMGFSVMAWQAAIDARAPLFGVRGGPTEGGCLVSEVQPESAADRAGLRVGDVIFAVDGVPVRDSREIFQVVREKQVGDRLQVDYLRDGQGWRVDATLMKRRE